MWGTKWVRHLEILVFRAGNLGFLGTNDLFLRDRAAPRNLEFLVFSGRRANPKSRLQPCSWAALVDAMMAVATPIIREAQGPDFTDVVPLMSGAVISRPGARVQRFHVDATHAHFEAAQANPSIRSI